MTETLITTQVCPRCIGTGKYSYNLKDGDRCYGCGGTGKVAKAPNGQAKIKPTVDITMLHKAVAGDIFESQKVLYRIEEIRWIKPVMKNGRNYNQQMKVTRLVDGKELFQKRAILEKEGERRGCIVIPSDEMIEQLYEG